MRQHHVKGATMKSAPQPHIRMAPIHSLRPHPTNPRVHPESAISKLVHSIQEFGWTNPILVDADGRILAGHARLKAAERAGLTEVPVIDLPLSGEKADAYLVADNRLQQDTDWDYPVLFDLMKSLEQFDFSSAIGMDPDEWEKVLAREEEENQSPSSSRKVDRKTLIRAILLVDQVRCLEQALRQTGKTTRSEALMALCTHYLETKTP